VSAAPDAGLVAAALDGHEGRWPRAADLDRRLRGRRARAPARRRADAAPADTGPDGAHDRGRRHTVGAPVYVTAEVMEGHGHAGDSFPACLDDVQTRFPPPDLEGPGERRSLNPTSSGPSCRNRL